MPRRIDVELTSARDDGTWTWRAAGARQPKGVVPGDLLYGEAKVGDVVQAEADFDVDGITITSVTPPKRKAGRNDLLELTGAGDEFQPVITNWKERAGGRDRDPYGEKTPRGDRPGGGPGGAGPGGGGRGGGDRGGNRGSRPTADWRAKVAPPTPPGGERSERAPRREGGEGRGRDRARGPREPRPEAGAGAGAGGSTGGPRPRPDRDSPRRERPARQDRPARPDRPAAGAERPDARPRPKRLSPGNAHRSAVLESLSPEQQPVAEQVLRGGIPAVRRAIEEQNTAAKAAGQSEIKPGPLVALAEELLPRLKAAEWHDRAEAAMASVDEIGLRDLRSVVSGAAAARDDETRTLAASLREALERRLKKQQDDWVVEITTALEESRLVRALRVASRPPDPSMRVPSEVAQRLAAAASEAMAADTPPERWGALLEAVAASPVRTTVRPAGLPENPGEALLHAARQQAGRIPALTTLLGITMPPPPGPPRRIPPKPTAPLVAPRPAPAAPEPPAATEPAAAPETPAAPEAIDATSDGSDADVATTEADPAPPTPVNDEPPSDIPTPPSATEPVPPVEPSATPAGDDVEAPADASVTAEGAPGNP